MIVDKFHLSLFDLLESIIYMYDKGTQEIVFVNKKMKELLEITEDNLSEINIPEDILNKLVKDYVINENTLIADDEYIEYKGNKYLVTRNHSVYEGRNVVLCICNKIVEFSNYDHKILETNDILIESIRILSKDEELFESIYKIISMIVNYYEADKAYIYENLTDVQGRGCSYEWDYKRKNKSYTASKKVNSEIKKWGKILDEKSIMIIEDIQFLKSKWPEKYFELKNENVKNIIIVVIKFLETPEGVIYLENVNTKKDYSLLSSLTHFILNEMKRRKISKKLNFMSCHDIITGLGNRNKYTYYLENIKSNTIKSVGVAFIDINGLKQINENSGHEFGDRAILEVGRCLKKVFRLIDTYRIGGDEFVIICENIKKEDFLKKIEQINKHFIELQEYSISMGYIWEENNVCLPELINKADEFMYKAKRNYYSAISGDNKSIYSSIVTEDEKGNLVELLGKDNSLDFENQTISFKRKQEIFSYKVKQMMDNPNYKNLIMVMLDINNFKVINEMYGFNKGNKILISINKAINNNIQGKGICCHSYSDIYYFCMESNSDEYTEEIINQIDYDISKSNPHTKINISYGIYKIENRDISVNEICERASYAHKMSKRENINKFVFYNEKIKEEMINEKEIENDMERAIENCEFKLYLQPKYNILTEKIEGAEALVRWQHPKKGLIFPNKFISIFEKNGFIIKLDLYMLEQVCKFIKKNEDEGRTNVPISINISKLNFKMPNLKQNILEIINKYQIDPNYIELEITESLLLEDQDKIIEIIKQFKEENLKISIDDFGTGYSSLNVLQKLPVDILKMDCGFFNDLQNDKKGKAIVKSIISLAKEIDLKVVAEGVEKQEEVDFLKEIGCEIIQGYYFSKPISLEDFEEKMYN